ncbi:hypothetical protein AVEN_69204-1, partial [Araneus ventricosus]
RPYHQVEGQLPQPSSHTRSYKIGLADDCFETENIRRTNWPARSPSLSPTENAGDFFGG